MEGANDRSIAGPSQPGADHAGLLGLGPVLADRPAMPMARDGHYARPVVVCSCEALTRPLHSAGRGMVSVASEPRVKRVWRFSFALPPCHGRAGGGGGHDNSDYHERSLYLVGSTEISLMR
jgi:hypothetical protein